MITPLKAEQLYTVCDTAHIPFETSDEVTEYEHVVGQERALDAIHFGTRITGAGYNVFALGPAGTGKHTVVRHILEAEAKNKSTPPDWCYVYNFGEPHKPNALRLPAGRGTVLRKAMEQLTEDLSTAIPAAFETEDYRAQIEQFEQDFATRRDKALNELSDDARKKDIQLVHTPAGFAFAPLDKNSEVIRPERFEKLSDAKKRQLENTVAELQKRLQRVIRQFPAWQKETREKIKETDRQIARLAAGHLIGEIKTRNDDLHEVITYLELVEEDIVEHVKDFRAEPEAPALFGTGVQSRVASLQRYKVNLIVDHSVKDSAPVIYQDLPTHSNLIGCSEYQSQMGTLVTDFTLIKPGDLHHANGGYLIIDARHLLQQPFAWESLKRALRSHEIRIEPLERSLGLISTISLQPEPIPLNVKVVLFGDRRLYYLLGELDPEFRDLFKVAADFEDTLQLNLDNCGRFARLVAGIVREHSLRPIDKRGVGRLIEHGARLAGDSEKISVHLRGIRDLLQEADYWAGEQDNATISSEHIQEAIDRKIQRLDRVRDHVYEAIERGIINIDTCDLRVGQINGLSVIDLGDFSFGQPSRITATIRVGDGHVIDIERETELGGKFHSKGVLILSHFLAARYAPKHPLSLSASLVFEQSYGMVDGDSASLAELCALLSVLGKIPIHQQFAVTGSVNQHGIVQAIGAVNQKIEGFFDICSAAGLNGGQGVIIPATNVKHLMLRKDIVEAVENGQFQVYAVDTVDQAAEILTGVVAGVRNQQGDFPQDTINGLVEGRMIEFANLRKNFAAKGAETKETPAGDSEHAG